MAQAPITKRTVDAAKPEAREYVVWDDALKGFGLKVTPFGSKVYIFRYRLALRGMASRTPPRKYTIGRHGVFTPDQARTRAKELAGMVARGVDPIKQKQDSIAAKVDAEARARLDTELAFEKVGRRWLAEYERGHRPRSYGQAALVMNRYLIPHLEDKPLPSITRTDLQAILDAIPAYQLATRRNVYAYASIFFGWAFQRGEIDANPLAVMAKPQAPKSRDRVLTDEELATIWQATESIRTPLGTFYRVLLLTGQRREEVAGMGWAELDRATATWVIPADRAKNGKEHIVPLAPAVVTELDRLALARQGTDEPAFDREKDTGDNRDNRDKNPLERQKTRKRATRSNLQNLQNLQPDPRRWPRAGPVMSIRGDAALSSFSQAKKLLDAAIASPLTPWRVHDLRRTLATGLQRLGVRYEVTEAVLNHVSGSRGGVAGIYQRHDWADEKRAALEAWANHVAAITHPIAETNVVPIGATRKATG